MKHRITIVILALLLAVAAVPVHAAEAPDLWWFAGERVTAVYSFDYAARTYQYVSDAAEAKKIVMAIPGVPVQTSGNVTDKNAVGFLIFTEKGKFPIYLPSSTEGLEKKKADLVELSKSCNKKYSRHMQWFVYMSPENIERITFSAAGGGNSYSLNPPKNPKHVNISIDTTDAATIRKISDYLKGFAVEPASSINTGQLSVGFWNPTTTMDLLNLTVYFKNGAIYDCFANFQFAPNGGGQVAAKDNFVITASDLRGQQIIYQLDTRAMRDFMMTVPGAVVKPL